jgi:hypothetical protein
VAYWNRTSPVSHSAPSPACWKELVHPVQAFCQTNEQALESGYPKREILQRHSCRKRTPLLHRLVEKDSSQPCLPNWVAHFLRSTQDEFASVQARLQVR